MVPYESDPADVQEVVRFTNIETIPLISNLSDDNILRRVFGSGIESQLIVILNQSAPASELEKITRILEEVALHNKEEDLKYERMVFAVAPTDYSHHLMADLIEDLENSKFKILLTRTNYNAFTLQRFMYSKEELSVESLKEFIEDFKLKKLQPFLRSEAKPTTQTGEILKVVGKTLNDEIYGSNSNILVLFYDSKDPHSHKEWRSVLQDFVRKYKNFYGSDLVVADFDLALNEHENIYLRYAPQLHLFTTKNKKQPHRFEGTLTSETLK